MKLEEVGERWKNLHDQCKAADEEARMACDELINQFLAFVDGKGIEPTEELVEETRRLERIARDAKKEEEAFLKKYFG